MTVDSLTAELEAARVKAMRAKQYAAAIAATMGKAKLHGFLVDRAEIDMTIRRPMSEPTDVKQMSLEEWQQKFASRPDNEPLQ